MTALSSYNISISILMHQVMSWWHGSLCNAYHNIIFGLFFNDSQRKKCQPSHTCTNQANMHYRQDSSVLLE
ncbi:hypothetical protein ZEAMMB73_Zm00001d015823 [Zea mays]|uniref:Uncharacterized protein n=1 Tax=Zea mays TaxID=4577 RepID=A0A1D6H466_MAIZE|nr:hypothetical protein ZEAMMB73_Zm00001d015823 [Zea mays]